MAETILRKCAACPDPIEIDRNHTSNVVFYKKKYYHSKCFCDLATKRSRAKIKSASEWKNALDNLWEIEADTKKMLDSALTKDELNDWLLAHYDVAVVPSRFWQIVADLERGIYKGKKCKPVSMETLLGAWKWGQRKLDEINKNNKMHHKGPICDTDRINYDLSIIINHVSDYEKFLVKSKVEEANRQEQKNATRINYDNIACRSETEHEGLDDISNLIDEFF